MSKGQLFDVVAVDIKTRKVRMIAKGKSEKNADAIVRMAVMRRGIDTEFFTEVDAGRYKEDDTYATSANQ